MGNPNHFSIKIFAGESPFEVAEKMQAFIHLSGFGERYMELHRKEYRSV
jgi:hypothetical protein